MPGLCDAEDQTQELKRASQAFSQLGCRPLPHKVAFKKEEERAGAKGRGRQEQSGKDFDLGLLTY